MKIFNNFDTNFKRSEYEEAVEKHWKKWALLIQRTFAFWVINWVIPLLIFVAVLIPLILIHFRFLKEISYLSVFFTWFIIVFSLFAFRFVFNAYLDYKMDFTIITNEWIFTFKQLWIFNSKNKDLPAWKIRSISSTRQWMLWNIFWYWNIEVITDWSLTTRDEDWRHQGWKMIMTYVKKPNSTRKQIIDVCLKKTRKVEIINNKKQGKK